MKIDEGFRQEESSLSHPFLDDPVLPELVQRFFPRDRVDDLVQEFTRFGDDINGYIRHLGTQTSTPTLVQYNHFSRRIDDLQTSEGWRALKRVAAKEGIVATGYERSESESEELARMKMFIKTYMWSAESQMVTCPMAMTDGAARVLELSGTEHMKQHLVPRLLNRDPELAYTAGQWMTERPGGSDVSHTETTALPILNLGLKSGAPYELSGVKWFSSATDGQLALALAQIIAPSISAVPANPVLPAPTSTPKQSLGLGLFMVPLPGADISLFTPDPQELVLQPRNGIGIHRLKNKIGTHALPTAELTLERTVGFLLLPGPANNKPGTGVVRPNGVRAIAPVLNITRVHSAVSSTGNLARCLAIAKAYALVRRVAGADKKEKGEQVLLVDVPLHTATLARVELVRRALTHFLFGVVRLLGRVETGKNTVEEQRRLRLLTPVLKAFAAELAVGGMEECMAALGGLGYMEETGLGRLIRDSLVEKIWEGTTNVLALDMIRVAREDSGASVRALCEWSNTIIALDSEGRNTEMHTMVTDAVALVHETLVLRSGPESMADHARSALLLVAHVVTATYLLEHAQWSKREVDRVIAARWIDQGGLRECMHHVIVDQRGRDQTRWDREIVYGRIQTKL
ncbi:acyl-CoA dehydrogenase [Ceratobasidium sp. AG-Ba]|nr:acyl-CoA dehydrogenase [Ceratobasidium sp. AG-Ba]QRV99389.1 acyl-CoA dehydrogenase [Ceratobasidium sp. AG-Ba]QRW13893.1 acyl-CoA dehydrogenase [Ceratobasidium sp. AG-Ba]